MSCVFFFQAEDGIRDDLVTGVQTCALPISLFRLRAAQLLDFDQRVDGAARLSGLLIGTEIADAIDRHGPPRSLRLIGAGSLGRLYEAALSERGFDVLAVDADEAPRLGLW